MMDVSKYAFVSVDHGKIKGTKLEFSKAAEFLAKKLPDQGFEYHRSDSDGVEIPADRLESWQRKAEKHHACCELLLDQMRSGALVCYVFSRLAGRHLIVPLTYWQRPRLSMPYDSKIDLTNDRIWERDRDLNGMTLELLIRDLEKLIRNETGCALPKQTRWDFEGCWQNKIRPLFELHGNLDPSDGEWGKLVHVELAIVAYFEKTMDGKIISVPTRRRYAHRYLDRYLDQFE